MAAIKTAWGRGCPGAHHHHHCPGEQGVAMRCCPRPQRPPEAPGTTAPGAYQASAWPGARASPGPQPSACCALQGPVRSPHHQPENLCKAGTVASPPGGGPSPQHRTGSGQWGPTVGTLHPWLAIRKGWVHGSTTQDYKTCTQSKHLSAGEEARGRNGGPTWFSPGSHSVEVSTQATGGLGVSQPPETVCHCQAHTPDAADRSDGTRRNHTRGFLGEDGKALTTDCADGRPAL